MGNTEGINKKVLIIVIIIVLLLGTIMIVNLFNNKNNEQIENNIDNNITKDSGDLISKNDNSTSQDSNNNVNEDGLITVTNQFTSSEESSNNGLIKVSNGDVGIDRYIPVNDYNVYNDNYKDTETVINDNSDKTAPSIKINYSKENITNENIIVTLEFNEPVYSVSNGFQLENPTKAIKEYTSNASEEITVTDLAGNESKVNVLINNIDKNIPNEVTITDTIFASHDIQTKITLSDSESGLNLNGCKYKIDNIENIENDNGYTKMESDTALVEQTVENDGTYYLHIISMDNAGNVRKENIKLIVDSVMPVLNIKYSNSSLTRNDVTVTITSNKPMQDVEGWTSNSNRTVFTKVYTNNVDEEVEFTDLVGRKIKAHIQINNIDKIKPIEPTLSKNIFNEKPIDNEKNIDITFKVNINDNENGSGLDLSKCKYILNQEQNAPDDFSSAKSFSNLEQNMNFTIKENSVYYLHIKLIDKVGNENITTQTIISDTLNPVVIREYDIKENTNKNVTVTIKSNETLTGTDGWNVSDAGKTLKKEFNKNIDRTIYTFYDLAGNPVSVDVTISNIDQVAPNDSVINKNIFNSNEFEIVTEISDIGFGLNLEECKYVLNSDEKANFVNASSFKDENETLKLKVEKDGIYYLHTLLKDTVGNEKITTHKIVIDTKKPEIKVSYSNKEMTNENVVVTLTSDEKLQELNGWTLSADKKQLTKSYTKNIDTNVEVKDIAGNIAEVNILIENIDKTKPEVEIEYSTTSQTNEPVTVTIKSNEKIQELEGWTLSDDQMSLTKIFEENDTQTITITDLAGNTITESIIVANIE